MNSLITGEDGTSSMSMKSPMTYLMVMGMIFKGKKWQEDGIHSGCTIGSAISTHIFSKRGLTRTVRRCPEQDSAWRPELERGPHRKNIGLGPDERSFSWDVPKHVLVLFLGWTNGELKGCHSWDWYFTLHVWFHFFLKWSHWSAGWQFSWENYHTLLSFPVSMSWSSSIIQLQNVWKLPQSIPLNSQNSHDMPWLW